MGKEPVSWRVVRGIATVCAFLLLFGPAGGRMTRSYGNGAQINGAGYDMVVLLAGVVAVFAFIVPTWRPGFIGPAFGALVGFATFGLAAWSAGSYALDLARLGFPFGSARLLPGGDVVVAPGGPPFFAAVAVVGLACCAVLVVVWLRPES